MKSEIQKAHDKFDQFEEQSTQLTDKFMGRVLKTSEEYSRKGSSILFGIIGGALSIPLGLTLAEYTFMHFAAISGPLFAIGIASGVLISRGKRWFRLEKQIEQSRMTANQRLGHADEILLRIEKLPKNAPPQVKNELWGNYTKLITMIDFNDRHLLAHDTSTKQQNLLTEGQTNNTESSKGSPTSGQ